MTSVVVCVPSEEPFVGFESERSIVSAFSTIDAVQRAVILRAQGKTTVGFSVLRALRFERPLPAVGDGVEGQLFGVFQTLIAGNASLEGDHR